MGRHLLLCIWNITVRYKFWRTYYFPGCIICNYCVLLCKRPLKSSVDIGRCVVVSFKFELSESILKQLIKHSISYIFTVISHLIHNMVGPARVLEKSLQLYFNLNIIQSTRGLKMLHSLNNSVPPPPTTDTSHTLRNMQLVCVWGWGVHIYMWAYFIDVISVHLLR